jgi:voltage-gated potassium channel Kch
MKPTFKQKVQYYFDNTLSRGAGALIRWLALATLIFVLIAIAVIILGKGIPRDATSVDVFWDVLYQALTPNPVDPTAFPPLFMVVTFIVTLGSLFMVSILIGILSNEIEDRIAALRRGRSLVLEQDHTLILGWSPQIFTILNELMIANENQNKAHIVVLADKDKVEMDDEVKQRIKVRGKTSIICRKGSPIDPNEIEIASPHTAKSIIVLPSESNDPDADVIKTVLAITNHPERRAEPYHIVTQISSEKNMDVLKMVGANDQVQAILTGDLIAHVVAQTSRQSGLSMVYTELMDFEGDEIYFKQEPSLAGKTFGEALLAYEDSSLMGIRKADGKILLNPPMDSVIESIDQIFAMSEDDDTIHLSGLSSPPINEAAIRSSGNPLPRKPEKCLILGWNRSGVTIVRELDNYVAKGSQITVVADVYNIEKQITAHGRLKNQKLVVQEGETTDRDLLNSLGIQEYDHVIVLAYSTLEPQQADAKTLVTLLHLRDMAEKDETPFSIVSEMLDLRNRELAESTRVDDFIVSEHLVSLMMSQLSENAELFDVFTDIFDPEGSEIYLKPVGDYVGTGEPVNFYTVVEAVRRRGQVAIGYRKTAQASDSSKSYGVHTNPRKSDEVVFAPEDKIIVIAEN